LGVWGLGGLGVGVEGAQETRIRGDAGLRKRGNEESKKGEDVVALNVGLEHSDTLRSATDIPNPSQSQPLSFRTHVRNLPCIGMPRFRKATFRPRADALRRRALGDGPPSEVTRKRRRERLPAHLMLGGVIVRFEGGATPPCLWSVRHRRSHAAYGSEELPKSPDGS